MAIYYKSRTKIGDSEPYWRLPSSPIVKKHVVSLRKFTSVLIYTWIAKPFVLPMQIFGNTKMKNKKLPYTIKAKRESAILSPTGGSRRRQ